MSVAARSPGPIGSGDQPGQAQPSPFEQLASFVNDSTQESHIRKSSDVESSRNGKDENPLAGGYEASTSRIASSRDSASEEGYSSDEEGEDEDDSPSEGYMNMNYNILGASLPYAQKEQISLPLTGARSPGVPVSAGQTFFQNRQHFISNANKSEAERHSPRSNVSQNPSENASGAAQPKSDKLEAIVQQALARAKMLSALSTRESQQAQQDRNFAMSKVNVSEAPTEPNKTASETSKPFTNDPPEDSSSLQSSDHSRDTIEPPAITQDPEFKPASENGRDDEDSDVSDTDGDSEESDDDDDDDDDEEEEEDGQSEETSEEEDEDIEEENKLSNSSSDAYLDNQLRSDNGANGDNYSNMILSSEPTEDNKPLSRLKHTDDSCLSVSMEGSTSEVSVCAGDQRDGERPSSPPVLSATSLPDLKKTDSADKSRSSLAELLEDALPEIDKPGIKQPLLEQHSESLSALQGRELDRSSSSPNHCDLPMPILTLESELDLSDPMGEAKSPSSEPQLLDSSKDYSSDVCSDLLPAYDNLNQSSGGPSAGKPEGGAKGTMSPHGDDHDNIKGFGGDDDGWPLDCLADERPPSDDEFADLVNSSMGDVKMEADLSGPLQTKNSALKQTEPDEDSDTKPTEESSVHMASSSLATEEAPKTGKKRKKKIKADSELQEGEKPKKRRKRKKKNEMGDEAGAEDGGTPKKKKKRKKKKKATEEDEDDDDDEDNPKKRKAKFERKNIRKILTDDTLESETKSAQREEMERKMRLLEKLQQQAAELRRQRDLQRQQRQAEQAEALETIQNLQLKSLLDDEEVEEEEDEDSSMTPEKITILPKIVTKKPEVVEISSSDDEKDIVMLPTAQDVVSEESEEEEDPTSSGSHTNDNLNQPDELGRVLVNVGHPTGEVDVFLAPQLACSVKPHQIGGIRFLYDNVVESLDRFSTSNGFGCILAHSMGLGKTLQLISFMDVFLRYTTAKSVLAIVPVNTLQNWVSEFNMWLPTEQDLREKFPPEMAASVQCRKFNVHVVNDNFKTNKARAQVVGTWYKEGGVLLMGYEMYRLLTSKKVLIKPKSKSRKNTPAPSPVPTGPGASGKPVIIDLEEEDRNRDILHVLQEALVKPGPDLVVCDEGHRIKNSHASISQSLKNVRTKRRVVLTGYPLQNNLLEYWCMVDFVRPNYLGTKTEFCNMFERPIMNGQCVDSTPQDAKLMRYRAHVLHSLLEGFVQRRGHGVLQTALPPKEEFVLLVRMSPIQRQLYNKFVGTMDDPEGGGLASWASNNPLKAFSVFCKIWNHPDVLNNIVQQRKITDDDLDIDDGKGDIEGQAAKKGRGKLKLPQSPARSTTSSPTPSESTTCSSRPPSRMLDDTPTPFIEKKEPVITYEWAEGILENYRVGTAEHSGKLVVLLSIIQHSVEIGDKLLIFSQSLFTLNLIEEFLSCTNIPGTQDKWAKNKSYFRLDGSTSGLDREKLINLFNGPDNRNVHLFLLSTRAGCLGINLVGANRVVIFDASWNPCHDCQAVCRVYRYGQIKPCYVYRLVTDNTLEKKIYDRQINKQGMSDRVVDELNPQNMLKKTADILLEYKDQDMPVLDPQCFENKTSDPVLMPVLRIHHKWITKEPFSHESLLIDRKDQKLTKSEKRLAKQGYEMEKKMSGGFSRPSYAAYYPKPGFSGELPRITNMRYPMSGGRPVASVRPMMSTPIPMRPQTGAGQIAGRPGVARLQTAALKPGVSVQQVKTTTDITIPGTTSSTSGPQKIPAGESVLVIKTPKGVYIRTNQGKIFAVRTAVKSPVAPTSQGPIVGPKLVPEEEVHKNDGNVSPGESESESDGEGGRRRRVKSGDGEGGEKRSMAVTVLTTSAPTQSSAGQKTATILTASSSSAGMQKAITLLATAKEGKPVGLKETGAKKQVTVPIITKGNVVSILSGGKNRQIIINKPPGSGPLTKESLISLMKRQTPITATNPLIGKKDNSLSGGSLIKTGSSSGSNVDAKNSDDKELLKVVGNGEDNVQTKGVEMQLPASTNPPTTTGSSEGMIAADDGERKDADVTGVQGDGEVAAAPSNKTDAETMKQVADNVNKIMNLNRPHLPAPSPVQPPQTGIPPPQGFGMRFPLPVTPLQAAEPTKPKKGSKKKKDAGQSEDGITDSSVTDGGVAGGEEKEKKAKKPRKPRETKPKEPGEVKTPKKKKPTKKDMENKAYGEGSDSDRGMDPHKQAFPSMMGSPPMMGGDMAPKPGMGTDNFHPPPMPVLPSHGAQDPTFPASGAISNGSGGSVPPPYHPSPFVPSANMPPPPPYGMSPHYPWGVPQHSVWPSGQPGYNQGPYSGPHAPQGLPNYNQAEYSQPSNFTPYGINSTPDTYTSQSQGSFLSQLGEGFGGEKSASFAEKSTLGSSDFTSTPNVSVGNSFNPQSQSHPQLGKDSYIPSKKPEESFTPAAPTKPNKHTDRSRNKIKAPLTPPQSVQDPSAFTHHTSPHTGSSSAFGVKGVTRATPSVFSDHSRPGAYGVSIDSIPTSRQPSFEPSFSTTVASVPVSSSYSTVSSAGMSNFAPDITGNYSQASGYDQNSRAMGQMAGYSGTDPHITPSTNSSSFNKEAFTGLADFGVQDNFLPRSVEKWGADGGDVRSGAPRGFDPTDVTGSSSFNMYPNVPSAPMNQFPSHMGYSAPGFPYVPQPSYPPHANYIAPNAPPSTASSFGGGFSGPTYLPPMPYSNPMASSYMPPHPTGYMPPYDYPGQMGGPPTKDPMDRK